MGKLLYILFIKLYPLAVLIIAPFNEKAARWRKGRKNILKKIQQQFQNNHSPVIWVHCSSLGEFEQGRPLIESLKRNYPGYKIFLTFFSPSGYEVQKNYGGADDVSYLPMDGKRQAQLFYDIVQPGLILFIKYEFWYYYLKEAKQRNIPLLLVSAIFRKDQPFFQWYGNFHRKMLQCFTCLFVQNAEAAALLSSIGIQQVAVSGDTRFDRVLEVAAGVKPLQEIEKFCDNKITIVAGSTWTEDDEALDHYANTHPDMRFIIVPHDIGTDRLNECRTLYKHSFLYSEYVKLLTGNCEPLTGINTIIIDNIGMLKYLYFYATISYVGGAFGGDGVHNVLEAAVYNKPVLFGPVYDKYTEAIELIDTGGAFTVEDALQLEQQLNEILNDTTLYEKACISAGSYVRSKTGATYQILRFIYEKRLLTK